jgi:hypothetical protein
MKALFKIYSNNASFEPISTVRVRNRLLLGKQQIMFEKYISVNVLVRRQLRVTESDRKLRSVGQLISK